MSVVAAYVRGSHGRAVASALLDHGQIDWATVGRVRFSLRQTLRYDYPSPIGRLRHRLMVLPPPQHGDQRLVSSGVAASGADVAVRRGVDAFGNSRYDVRAAWVETMVEFEAWAVVERRAADGPTRLPAASLHDPRWLRPTPLTWPDQALEDAATRLARDHGDDPADALERARSINTWVHKRMRYRLDVTNVDTTAARAFGLGQGVCQDYAHVMLAICRLGGLPARYVSGQLLGEGGSHAWVEVLVPASGGDGAVAVAFDPTHGRETGLSYLTVAVGRDYADVAPTYGTFQGASPGHLSTAKALGISEVDLLPG